MNEPSMPSRPRLADGLEPGRLRQELTGEAPPPLSVVRADLPDVTPMSFTGEGAEYFRIWVVNLLLTIVTLGIYSAWAKVRKMRYFWQNTRLASHVFDYHANPWAILRGRVIALVLLGAYSWAFEFSTVAGLVTIGALFVTGPWLFLKAQRFKLGNSSHRGLRFGFDSTTAQAYRIIAPILALWFSATVLTVVATDSMWPIGIASLATGLGIPWMHHRLKSYQHAFATYGDRRFAFEPSLVSFYWVYAKGFVLVLLGGIAGGLLTVPFMWTLGRGDDDPSRIGLLVMSALYGLGVYVFAWPYLAARLQQVVWDATRLGDVRFHTIIEAWPLGRLVANNVLLTLATAGLYWPFASVALARYRVGCMRVSADLPFAVIAAGTHAPSGATGDASADAFGLDIGL